ncbi:MAG TPA: type II toxin-antitoxin system RelE/ParE family toxin [Thermodesulfobacteriota bacterium]|nr:type II toxin-antitoxin system RelE/ParE family toxin [Thermodesulfobacteriota bacterium]
MASYNIVFKPSVEKDLRSLPKSVIVRVLRQIETLRKNPFARQSVKLAGAEKLYRIRVGDYRVVYAVDKGAQEITVHYIRHRREVYRG